MTTEFWIRVLIEVIAFTLVMYFLFRYYAAQDKKPDMLEVAQVRHLEPGDLGRLGETIFSIAVEMQEGMWAYKSGAFVLYERDGDFHFESNLVLSKGDGKPALQPFPMSKFDAAS